MEPYERELFRELADEVCWCGRKKKPKQSYCRQCFFSLPPDVQKALYREFMPYLDARIAAGHILGEKKLFRFELTNEFKKYEREEARIDDG